MRSCFAGVRYQLRCDPPPVRLQVAAAPPLTMCKCVVFNDGDACIEVSTRYALRQPGELQHLLATLLPGAVTLLVALSLAGNEWFVGEEQIPTTLSWLRGCALLGTLLCLDAPSPPFMACAAERDSAEAALEVLLEQAPALVKLVLSGFDRLPACVRVRPGLRNLQVHGSWQELPAGQYLECECYAGWWLVRGCCLCGSGRSARSANVSIAATLPLWAGALRTGSFPGPASPFICGDGVAFAQGCRLGGSHLGWHWAGQTPADTVGCNSSVLAGRSGTA